MKKIVFLSLIFIPVFSMKTTGQTVYMDASVIFALNQYDNSLKSKQNETHSLQQKIRNGQTFVQAQLQTANNLHERFLKGLCELSGVVNDALVIARIYEVSSDIVGELQDAVRVPAQYPHYAIFASRAINNFRQRSINLSGDVARVITGGENNLMDSGERHRLLGEILIELRLMRGAAFGISSSIKRAVQLGFFRSMNPFQTWVNQDAQVIRRILKDAAAV